MSDAQAAPVTENGVSPVAQEEAPGHKVFVGNLAYATTDEGLKTLFAPFASDIISASVILRPIPRGGNTIRSAGYGFVALSTAEAAQKAIETLDKKELDGREVMVQLAKPSEQKEKEKKEKKAKRRPGRRGSKAVPGEVSEAEANGEAPQAEGTPAPESGDAAKPKKKKKSKAARKAKKAAAAAGTDGATTEETAAAPAAEGEAAAEGSTKKPRVRKPKAPRPPRPAGEDPAGEPSTTMLFVANLGFNVDDAGLSTLFTEAGINVVSARIVRRRWGQPRKSKGYGFVDVGSEAEQKKAIAALEGKEVGGRAIAVKVAVNTPHEDTADEATPAPADEAKKKAQIKNEENRRKSRRQLELEAREEGLSKSLFERAKEEEASGSGTTNKALSIMMKMGFKPGQSLGNTADQDEASSSPPINVASSASNEQKPISSPLTGALDAVSTSDAHITVSRETRTKHKTEPLPLQEWEGRKGIGLGKRARSPSAAERLSKMAKMAKDMDHRDFRDRARDEYKNRQAEGRLVPAQRTCVSLDEQMGKSFNILWLNPNNRDTFPAGLLEALTLHSNLPVIHERQGDTIQNRLRKQMQVDALQPINDDDDLTEERPENVKSSGAAEDQFSPELLEEATQFLRLQDRLHLVLSYLRDKHAYCFWCGVTYESEEEMQQQCPGPEEDDHD
ncbi:hypothetical protein BJ912DRAFT_1018351 [Pholiota molesta]|nr:hypothetical protein BJ912DRAFT_1018351 [Pholiota molesta]